MLYILCYTSKIFVQLTLKVAYFETVLSHSARTVSHLEQFHLELNYVVAWAVLQTHLLVIH